VTEAAVEKEVLKRRLYWRCRIGTRELELLLYRYIDSHYESLTMDEIETFNTFIEQSHDQLQTWLLTTNTVPEDGNQFKHIIHAIKNAV